MPSKVIRKVSPVGSGGKYLVLPKGWCDYYEIKVGEELVVICDGTITIYPPDRTKNEPEKSLVDKLLRR